MDRYNTISRHRTASLVFCLAVVAVCSCVTLVYAQEGDGPVRPHGKGKGYYGRRQELLELRKQDPEKFRALVTEKRATLKRKLVNLKEEDPEKYQQVVKRFRQNQVARLRRLKEENPELFRRMVEKRRAVLKEKLKALKEKDPQRYEKIMAYREKLSRSKGSKGKFQLTGQDVAE